VRTESELINDLLELYERIDDQANQLVRRHGHRLKCRRGCATCCVDDLSVFEVEARNIQTNHGDLLRTESAHESGGCAFLDHDGCCRIYRNRPYVCRTQGLPLRWIDETDGGDLVEMRDICPLNDEGEPVEELSESDCWTIGPVENELRGLACEQAGGEMRRVKLRDLFQTQTTTG